MPDNTIVTMIQLRETNLHVGSYIIPLHGRKKMMQLIQIMISDEKGMSRAELRGSIYKQNSSDELSFRLRDSQDCSLSKLISRSRRYLKLALDGTPWGRSIDWFVYHEQEKFWSLHKLRSLEIQLELKDFQNLNLVPIALETSKEVHVKTYHHQVKVVK